MLKIRRFKKKPLNEGLLDDLDTTTQSAASALADVSYRKYIIQEFFSGDDSYADNEEVRDILNRLWRGEFPEQLSAMDITVTMDDALRILRDYYPGDRKTDIEKYVDFLSKLSKVLKSGQMQGFFLMKTNSQEEHNNALKKIFLKQMNIDFSSYYQEDCDYFFKIYKYVTKNFEYFRNMTAWTVFFVKLQDAGLDAGTITIPSSAPSLNSFIMTLIPEPMKNERFADARNRIISEFQNFISIPRIKKSLTAAMFCDIFIQIKQILRRQHIIYK